MSNDLNTQAAPKQGWPVSAKIMASVAITAATLIGVGGCAATLTAAPQAATVQPVQAAPVQPAAPVEPVYEEPSSPYADEFTAAETDYLEFVEQTFPVTADEQAVVDAGWGFCTLIEDRGARGALDALQQVQRDTGASSEDLAAISAGAVAFLCPQHSAEVDAMFAESGV
jgi:hypothetical protein